MIDRRKFTTENVGTWSMEKLEEYMKGKKIAAFNDHGLDYADFTIELETGDIIEIGTNDYEGPARPVTIYHPDNTYHYISPGY